MIILYLDGLVLHIDTALEAAQLIGALRSEHLPRRTAQTTLDGRIIAVAPHARVAPTPAPKVKPKAKPLTASVRYAASEMVALDRVVAFLRGKPPQALAAVLAGAKCSHSQLKRFVKIGAVAGSGATIASRRSTGGTPCTGLRTRKCLR